MGSGASVFESTIVLVNMLLGVCKCVSVYAFLFLVIILMITLLTVLSTGIRHAETV